jgi:enoyl-CoA hydratase
MVVALHIETRGTTGLLTLDRPERAHAYDRTVLEAIASGFAELEGRCHVVIIQSTGDRAFCGGADLQEMQTTDPLDALDLFSQRVFNSIARSPVLTIAAVQGAAIAGGFELTLACDIRVVGPAARFELPETALGLVPSAGGSTRLTRLVGPSLAKQVILAGRSLSAEDALQHGLAIQISPDPRAAALELAKKISTRDPLAQRLAKGIVDGAEDTESLQAERVAEALLYARKQARED